MGLSKYKGFVAGQPFPAENANSIDPDNLTPLSAGYLTGGEVVDLSYFKTLALGADNGAIKATIDGVDYDNITVDLSVKLSELFNSSQKQDNDSSSSTSVYSTSENCGQVFLNTDLSQIKSVNIKLRDNGNQPANFTIRIRNGAGMGGTVLGTTTVYVNPNTQGIYTASFSTPIEIVIGQKYTITIQGGSDAEYKVFYSTTSLYSEKAWLNSAERADLSFYFVISGYSLDGTRIASALQTAIRTATGKTETVVYSNNKFIITSSTFGKASEVLKLMTPTTGTDISGAGATAYLDCASNATETAGTGDDYNLVRLNGDGIIPKGLLSPMEMVGATQTRSDGTIYRNTSKRNMLIIASMSLNGGAGNSSYYGQADFFVDSASTPTNKIASARNGYMYGSTAQSIIVPVIFIVPPSYYYKWLSSVNGGSASVSTWYETYL